MSDEQNCESPQGMKPKHHEVFVWLYYLVTWILKRFKK